MCHSPAFIRYAEIKRSWSRRGIEKSSLPATSNETNKRQENAPAKKSLYARIVIVNWLISNEFFQTEEQLTFSPARPRRPTSQIMKYSRIFILCTITRIRTRNKNETKPNKTHSRRAIWCLARLRVWGSMIFRAFNIIKRVEFPLLCVYKGIRSYVYGKLLAYHCNADSLLSSCLRCIRLY